MSTTILTTKQLVDLRRFCGFYPKRKDGNHIIMGVLYTQDGELEYALGQLTGEENDVIVTQLARLNTMEDAEFSALDSVGTAQAAVWTRNKDEFAERLAIYTRLRLKLCETIGIRPGPLMQTGSVRWTM